MIAFVEQVEGLCVCEAFGSGRPFPGGLLCASSDLGPGSLCWFSQTCLLVAFIQSLFLRGSTVVVSIVRLVLASSSPIGFFFSSSNIKLFFEVSWFNTMAICYLNFIQLSYGEFGDLQILAAFTFSMKYFDTRKCSRPKLRISCRNCQICHFTKKSYFYVSSLKISFIKVSQMSHQNVSREAISKWSNFLRRNKSNKNIFINNHAIVSVWNSSYIRTEF